MKKRLVAFLLVLIMVLGMLPVSAMAAPSSNETQTIEYQILYVGDEFHIGYNYGASVNKTYTCQYGTGHSGYNHSILISEFKNVGVPALKDQLDSGYEFVGWAKEAKKNPGIFGFDTAGTTATQTTYTIYLVAKKPAAPQVTYVLNYDDSVDDNSVTNMPASQSEKNNKGKAKFAVSTLVPVREGYTFKGWQTSDGTKVGTTVEVTAANNPMTIYAVWEENAPPTPDIPEPEVDNITADLKVKVVCTTPNSGHEPAFYSLIDGTFTHTDVDQSGDYPTCSIRISPDKYISQYSTDKNCQHTTPDDPKTVPLLWNKEAQKWAVNDDQIGRNGVVFNAVCEAVPETFTVTYTDGVDGEEVFPDQVYPDLGKNSVTPAFNGTPNREGYTFAGWEPEVAGTVNENATYTAKWIKLPTAEEIAELGITVNVKCVNETGAEEQKIYTVTADDIEVTGFAASNPITANFWIKTDRFVGLYSTDTEKVHTKSWPENGGLGWCVYFNDNGSVSYAQECDGGLEGTGHTNTTIEVKHEEVKPANVHLMIFKSNDLVNPIVNTKYTTDAVDGDTLDLTALDPKTYLKFDFEIDGGWYDDGRFNQYTNYVNGKQANKPAALTKLQINGDWQNLKLIVTELVPVVYFDSLESLTAYQNDHSKREGILHTTKARVGSDLPTADAPAATREGYTFTFWSREGQTGDVTGQTVNGWTNLYANWEKKTYKVVAKLYVNGKPAYYQNKDFYTYEVSGLYGEDIDFDTIKAKAVEQAKQIKKASASYTAVILEDHEPNPVCTTYGEHQPGQATHYVKVNVKTEEKVVIFQSFEGKTDLTKLYTTTAPYGTNVVEFLNGLDLDLDVAGYTLDTAEGSNTNWYKKDSPKWTFGTNDTINGWTNVLLKYTITPHNIYAFANLTSYFAPLTADEFDTHITLNDATLSRLGLGSYNSLGYIPIGTFDFDEMPLTEDLYMAYYEDPEIDAVAEELAKSIVLETGVTKETALKIVWASLFKNVNKENMELGYPTDDAEGYQFTGNLYLATVAFKAGGDNVKNMPAVNYTCDDFFEIHDFYFPGETVTLTEPTREGYTFKGWSVTVLPGAEDASALSLTGAGDAADDEDLLPAGTVYTVTAGGAIFTAQWELKTYIIASDLRLNGTTVMVVKPDPAKSYPWSHRYGDEFGKTIDYTDMFKTLKEKALEVDAANEPCDVEIELRFPGDKNRDGKLFNEVITTYGQTGGGWNPGNKNTAPIWGYGTSLYEVIFDYDYDDKTDTQIVKYSEKATSVTPTREGYNFLGWFNADGTEFSFDTEITHKTTVTAKWEKKTYTIASDLRINGNVANLEDTGRYAWTHRYGDKYGETIDYQPMFAALKARALAVDAANEPYDAEIELRFPGDKNRDGKLFNETIQTYGQAGGGWNPGVKNTAYIWGYATTSYQVIFDDNGSAVDTQIVKYGEKATEPTAPTKTGYTFDGWYDADGNKFDFTNNTITHKTVLTAKWTANTYKVKFAANGGEGKMDDQNFTYDVEQALTANAFTRAGYTFANWKDAAGNTYTDGQKVKNLTSAANGEVTLTAQWTANTDTPYKVEHYLENLDGSYTLDTTEDLKGTTDTTATATPKTDYANFTYDSAVSGTVASGNIAGDGSLVLKLFYTRNTYDYTVRHIKQLPDGTYDEANAEVEKLSGKFEALAAVTAKNYGSHYPTNNAGTKQNIKIEKNLTIDVKYDLDNHTLTFETNGGSTIAPVTVRHGNAVARPADPTKDKYTFIGWYVDPEFSAEYDFATVLEADKTIYAKFELTATPIGDIYVRYDVLHIKQLPDGSYDLANAEVEHLNAKKDTTVTAVVKDYSASHHVTVNTDKSLLTDTAIQPHAGADGKPVYTILKVYYDLDYHTLTFDTMGGSTIAPVTVRHGLTVAKPTDPTRFGYWFGGWYTSTNYTTEYDFATPLTADITIYAKWSMVILPNLINKKAPKLNTSDHFAYVQGYPDGTVKPAGNITRAETAAILFRLMDESSRSTYYSTRSGFRDVASGTWYNTYVATLNNAGVITDSANGYFRPNDAITRAELAAMLAAFTDTTHAANYFNDVTANYWAANAIAVCAKLGWITGYPDGSFRPDRNVTRAELMAMINRATGRAPKSADAFLPGMKTWSDNTADKWYYLDVQEATNSHSYTVRPTEIWTAITAAPNWSKYE